MKPFSIRSMAPLVFTLMVIFAPLVVVGQVLPSSVQTSDGSGNNVQTNGYTNNVQTRCNGQACSVENPLRVTSFCSLLKLILQALLVIGLPIAVLFLVLVGFKFVLAQGNPKGLAKARMNLLYTIIGIAVFIGAWTIATVIAKTMEALGVQGISACIN